MSYVRHPPGGGHPGYAPQDTELLRDRPPQYQRRARPGVRESTLERFRQGKGPDGRRWKSSKRAILEGGKTLVKTAQLRNSIHARSDASGFAVGTNAKHAATHQFGEPGRIIRARRKKVLRFQYNGKWVSKKQVRVKIPARPFLGLSDEDMQEMKATVEDFIGREG